LIQAGRGGFRHGHPEKCFTLGQYDKNPGASIKPFLLFTLLLLPFGQAIAQQSGAASLRERMGPEQFKAAGLDKLSADELKHLDNWIAGVKTVVVEKVVEKQVEDFSDINSALVGEFRGWRGYTEFTLANGQV
jgi:hypothetical protein